MSETFEEWWENPKDKSIRSYGANSGLVNSDDAHPAIREAWGYQQQKIDRLKKSLLKACETLEFYIKHL